MSYYNLLGVDKSAGKDEIKKAYRKLAMQKHPDKGGDPEEFKKITEAYETLQDDEKRSAYDNPHQHHQMHGGVPADLFEMFGNMFGGGGGGGPRRMADEVKEFEISLKRVFSGAQIKFKINLEKSCEFCEFKCNACNGMGRIRMAHPMMPMMQIEQPCNRCGGAGNGHSGCLSCKGGKVRDERMVQIDVPAGCKDGHAFVLEGMGQQRIRKTDVPGNLVMKIKITPDEHFTREGDSLVYKPIITFKDSIVGIPLIIPHFSGEFIYDTRELGIIDPRKVYEIKGRGMNSNSPLKIIFNIKYPIGKLSAEDLELFQLKIKNV
jgi:DnaJ family protein A protein 2